MMRKKQPQNAAAMPVARPASHRRMRNSRTLILMSLPAVIYFLVFCYLPMPGAYIAFTDFNYHAGIFGSRFVGMNNFKFLWKSGKLWLLTRNTILYNLAFIVIGNFLQIFIALLLNEVRLKWFKKLSQSLMFLPYFISDVLVGLIAFDILNSDYGFLPSLIRAAGGAAPDFYSNPGAWPPIIILTNLWKTTGYGSIVYFATICGMDVSMMEASQIDGANALQRIWYVLLPNLRPTVVILMLFSIGGILKGNFGLFYNLVGSANAALLPNTDIIETYVYRTLMNQFNFPYSTAVGLYQSVFGFVIIMVVNGIVRKIEPDYALF
ncbi:MAG: ABC transporter permease subunit [Oscillospiraceae bacterium]|jgi:putative aldouronate transport system permease protein|nr:ABC transporter permease subunit [Oscillospiraceae bacterium]